MPKIFTLLHYINMNYDFQLTPGTAYKHSEFEFPSTNCYLACLASDFRLQFWVQKMKCFAYEYESLFR